MKIAVIDADAIDSYVGIKLALMGDHQARVRGRNLACRTVTLGDLVACSDPEGREIAKVKVL